MNGINHFTDSLPVSFLQNTFEPHVPQPLSKQESCAGNELYVGHVWRATLLIEHRDSSICSEDKAVFRSILEQQSSLHFRNLFEHTKRSQNT
ncbi:hypothetical protein AV530_007914 [Patagioenas fasciata monilis]|uniref:Uncharacterized protein n=1 Tax=Patagioenas fasciata monilis TaxID=372326 RepID=A0A1V4JGV0_PATFA|nr:hypothetical protein AV530_007914 [Patagioenas fasciata monilis]